ncbi:MAG: Cation-transporting ATPase, family, partial [Holophagaceae bacterium]|nr:Cation-transporting ATPase, family [Holophagaceae bacterium]
MAEAAKAALAKHGPNELPSTPPVSAWRRIVAQFANPIVLTLLVAAVVATVNGASSNAEASFLVRYGDAIAIGLI